MEISLHSAGSSAIFHFEELSTSPKTGFNQNLLSLLPAKNHLTLSPAILCKQLL
jgi:hypothetical protein